MIKETRKYYLDEELNNVLLEIQSAYPDIEEVKNWKSREKELLAQKGQNEATYLRTEPSLFQYNGSYIIAYLDPTIEMEIFISELIKGYKLEYLN